MKKKIKLFFQLLNEIKLHWIGTKFNDKKHDNVILKLTSFWNK